MVSEKDLTQEKSKTVQSDESSTEKKIRPQHSECKFARDGLCTSRASLFFNEVRELDALVCSAFQKRDT